MHWRYLLPSLDLGGARFKDSHGKQNKTAAVGTPLYWPQKSSAGTEFLIGKLSALLCIVLSKSNTLGIPYESYIERGKRNWLEPEGVLYAELAAQEGSNASFLHIWTFPILENLPA